MPQSDPAKSRFIALQAIRLSGVVLGILGALILARIVDLPPVTGYIFLAVGLLDVFVIPLMLGRKWKSPK